MSQSYCSATAGLLCRRGPFNSQIPWLFQESQPEKPLLPLPGPPYFRIQDLPVELQCGILECVIKPWSLYVGIKSGRARRYRWWTLKLISCRTKVANIWVSKEVDRLLQLLTLHPRLREAISRTLRKRYNGIAHLHSEKRCTRAALSNWHLPQPLKEIVQQSTKAVHIGGLFPTKRVKELFPKVREIIYHPGAFPFRTGEDWSLSRDFSELIHGSWDTRFVIGAEMYLKYMNHSCPDTADDNAVEVSFRAQIQENCRCGEWHHSKDGVIVVKSEQGRYHVVSRRIFEKDAVKEPEVEWKHVGSCKLRKLRKPRDLRAPDAEEERQQDELADYGENIREIFGWRTIMIGLLRHLFRRRPAW